MGNGRTQYAETGRRQYAAIIQKRGELEAKAAGDADTLALPERVFLQFSRKIEEAMPERLERSRKDCLRDLRDKSKLAHWAVTHLPPLGKLNDMRLQQVYEGLAQGEIAQSLYYSVRRSVEDIKKRSKEDAARRQATVEAQTEALEKALASGGADSPFKVGKPLQLKPKN